MIVIGVDIGSVATKGVLINDDQRYYLMAPTGWSPRQGARDIIKGLMANCSINRAETDMIMATGYGRVSCEEADKTVTEISCQARGISALYPAARTIIDIGGQDSKVIKISKAGKVSDFAMNDKCAAGTGRFLQVMATALGMDVSELEEEEDPEQTIGINSMCTVFAETEIISLLAKGKSKGGIIAGLHQSVARRVTTMARRLKAEQDIIFTGGVAINSGIKRAIMEELQTPVTVPEECQFTGALGAALLAAENLMKDKNST